MRNLENPSAGSKRLLSQLALVLIVMIALCVTSCKVTRHLKSNKDTVQTDSIVIKEIVRDTTIIVEADSSMLQALIECDSLGQAHIKELLKYKAGERLKPPTVIIRDNMLTATVNTDSLEIKIQWLERVLEHYKNNVQTITDIKYIEVHRLTWWQTLWIWIGRIAVSVIVILIIYKTIKHYGKS